MVKLPTWEPTEVKSDADIRLLPPTVQTELEVITAIDNLSNTVIANTASRSLARSVLAPNKASLTYPGAHQNEVTSRISFRIRLPSGLFQGPPYHLYAALSSPRAEIHSRFVQH